MKPTKEKRILAGLGLSKLDLSGAVQEVIDTAQRPHEGRDVHLINAYSVSLTVSDPIYYSCLREATLNYPDGRSLGLATKFSKDPLNQVRGPELFEQVLDEGRKHGLKHYFLGSTIDTLKLLTEQVVDRFPEVEVVGSYSPPFRRLTSKELAEQDRAIRAVSPDIVWVGLGTPKQDIEAKRLAAQGFNAIAVGAAFDFTAGTLKSAPAWSSRAGVEWLFRLSAEPKRLWRRYLIGNWVFLFATVVRRNR